MMIPWMVICVNRFFEIFFGHALSGVRIDGAAPRGLWPPAGGRLCSLRSGGQGERFLRLTGPMGRRVLKFDGPSGRGLWYRPPGDEYKFSVTDSPFCVIWHDRHSDDWLAALASPYPASPDLPRKRGQNKALKSSPFISSSQHNGAYSAPAKWGWQRNWIHRGAPRPANPVTCFPPGKVVAPATKGGISITRQGGCQGFIIRGRLL